MKRIPLPARIFTVADACGALQTYCPYREAWPDEKALVNIKVLVRKHFVPKVVDMFL